MLAGVDLAVLGKPVIVSKFHRTSLGDRDVFVILKI